MSADAPQVGDCVTATGVRDPRAGGPSDCSLVVLDAAEPTTGARRSCWVLESALVDLGAGAVAVRAKVVAVGEGFARVEMFSRTDQYQVDFAPEDLRVLPYVEGALEVGGVYADAREPNGARWLHLPEPSAPGTPFLVWRSLTLPRLGRADLPQRLEQVWNLSW